MARPPYDTDTLQNDVLALLAHLSASRAHIVGHDWGAAVTWLLAIQHPEAVHSLTIMNVPHPALFLKGVRRPRQLARSWYMLFFQLPWLPERLLAGWRRQGLGGGLNWYRALFRGRLNLPQPVPKVTAPTLMIWGEEDRALGKELTYGTEEYVEQLALQYLPGISHWVQQEAPHQVTALLREHLTSARGPMPAGDR